ncbi:MAG TPA: glycosyltransferase [Pyrinomonadaceae bacterium]|nr:glycosyltransferase [Pyrinomonadaceae bacterium]
MSPRDDVVSVVHLVDATRDRLWGKEWVILWLMEAQRSSKKIDPQLVTFFPSRLNAIAAENGFVSLSLDRCHHRFPLAAVQKLQAILKASAQVVLHTHGYKPNIVGRLAQLIGSQDSALISTCHGWVEDSLALKFYNALDRRTSLLSDRIVVPDPNMVERLPAFTSTTVIPNAIPNRCVPTEEQRRVAKWKFGWREDQFVVGMLTRITKQKGIDEFEHANSLAGNPNILWVVAGAAADAPLSIKEHRQRDVQFIDYMIQSGEYLAALDVFVQASHSEGLSLALLEAARYALPIVATKVGATECTIRDGKEGLLIPAKNPKRLADSISMLYDDPHLARRLGEAARRRFEECYQIERMNDAYLTVYRNVLRRKCLSKN